MSIERGRKNLKTKEKSRLSLLSVKVPEEVHTEIKDYCEDNGVMIKKFVEVAALEYMRRYKSFNCSPQSAVVPAMSMQNLG